MIDEIITRRSRYSDPEFQRIFEQAESLFEKCCSENVFGAEFGDCDECPVSLKCSRFNDKVLAVLDRRNPHHNPTEIMGKIRELQIMKHCQLKLKGV
jgi:hypothetical protein